MPRAFDYTVAATRRVGSRTVYVLRATPRKGYDPPNIESRVLTAMQGEFWIDTITFQWVRASARVLRPVSIAGIFARVQPGTAFEVEQMPISGASGFRSTSRSNRGARSCSSSTITSTRKTPTSITARSQARCWRAGLHGPWLAHPAAINFCLLSIGLRSGVEAHRVDALRAAPNTESGRSVAFNICSRNRPAQCKPVQTDVEAVADWADP